MSGSPARIVFAGTPEFARISLQALIDKTMHDICAVYTQPDRPAGRGRKLRQCEVKTLAQSRNLLIRQPESMRTAHSVEELASLKPDLMIVVAYGQILTRPVLDIPRLGCINVHASLLPRWRGSAPIQRAILAGDAVTGATIMLMDEKLDAGPVLNQCDCPIEPNDSAGELHDRLANIGADCLIETLPMILGESLIPIAQDAQNVTYAEKLSKQEAEIDWSRSSRELDRSIRAFIPWPVSHTSLAGFQMRIWQAELRKTGSNMPPGSVISTSSEGIDVSTGDGALRILKLQLPGKKVVSAADFLNANPEFPR